ncbi:Anp1-domain-containing protein [Gongronella butleri]|nr:Anp1-domain-containing protein [Gongronella butleri]
MVDDSEKKRIGSVGQPFRRKRLLGLVLGVILVVGCLTWLFATEDCIDEQQMLDAAVDSMTDGVHLLSQQQPSEHVLFQNLNEPVSQEQVVVLSVLPPWAIGDSLDAYFASLSEQTHALTRVALLVLNPASPATSHAVRNAINAAHLPFPVQLYTKTFDPAHSRWVQQQPHQDQQSVYELEPLRRSTMARARNYLLQTALDPMDQYVLWLDPVVTDYPVSFIDDMIRIMAIPPAKAIATSTSPENVEKAHPPEKNAKDDAKTEKTDDDDKLPPLPQQLVSQPPKTIDILAPNTMIIKGDAELGYERGNWQETETSKALQDTVAEDFVFMEGFWEFDTHRFLMIDMETTSSHNETMVPLDGVGGSCLFVRADVHRGGINFPPYVYKHQLDTESFAKAASVDGYGIFGLPNYKVYAAPAPLDTDMPE